MKHDDSTMKIQITDLALAGKAQRNEAGQQPMDVFADLEATLDEVAEANPRIKEDQSDSANTVSDLKALLEVSLAINSSLVLDDILEIVMHKAIELMQAERGLIMLTDSSGELQVRSAYNLEKEEKLSG
jgi:hypothetical protein